MTTLNSEIYDTYVGGITPQEFLDGYNCIDDAVDYYCGEGWPQNEPCTPEIKEAIAKYLEDCDE